MNRAIETIKRIVRTVAAPTRLHRAPGPPVPDSTPLRPWVMPDGAKQAMAIQRQREWNNGRYYLIADVVLEDGTLLRDVEFDGDTHIAVAVGDRPVWEFPAYLAKAIVDFFTVRDAASGSLRFEADGARRAAFAARYSASGQNRV